jgi:hypothetical protein
MYGFLSMLGIQFFSLRFGASGPMYRSREPSLFFLIRSFRDSSPAMSCLVSMKLRDPNPTGVLAEMHQAN